MSSPSTPQLYRMIRQRALFLFLMTLLYTSCIADTALFVELGSTLGSVEKIP